ncbi:MAG: hypothetical protein ACRD0Z_01425, partial [Acidimicrobiales bacterium]
GEDSCFDVTRGGTDQYLFDETTGDLVSEIDPNGNTVSLAYSSGVLQTVTGESGVRQLSFTYSGGKLSEVTDSAGRTASFAYTSGNLTSMTLSASTTHDPLTHEWAFSYISSGHLLSDWWSPDNQAAYAGNSNFASRVSYDSSDQVTQVIDPDWLTQCDGASGSPACAPTTSFDYASFDPSTGTGTILVSDPDENYDTSAGLNDGNGNTTLDTYTDGVLTAQSKGYGYETSTTAPYDQYPMASQVTYSLPDPSTLLPAAALDGDGNLTQTSYGASGKAIESIDPLGNVTTDVYNKFGEVIQETDPLGNVTSYAYDSRGNLLSTTNPLGDTTSSAYLSDGLQCASLSADGYALGDRLTSCPSGAEPYTTLFGYDSEGDQTSQTSPDGDDVTVLYNAAGQACATLSADGYASGDRLPVSCPSSAGAYESVMPSYDVFGTPLETEGPSNAQYGTATTYTTTDYDGNTVAATSALGEPPSLCDPLSNAACPYTSYTVYNTDGEQVGSVEAPDPPGSGVAGPESVYSIDPDGGSLAWTNADESVSTCNPLLVDPVNGSECADTTYWTLDNLGRQVGETDSYGNLTTFSYDAAGYETASTSPGTTNAPGGTTTALAYDADYNVVSTTQSGGGLGDSVSLTTTFGYDADGNQVCESQPDSNPSDPCPPAPAEGTVTPDTSTTIYNGAGQVSETVSPSGYDTWQFYDASGNNIATTTGSGNPATCSPPAAACPYTSYNGYDEANRKVSATTAPEAGAPNGEKTTYAYDADGNICASTDPEGNETVRSFDGADNLTAVGYADVSCGATFTPAVSYSYNADRSQATMTDSSGTTTWVYNGDGEVVSLEDGAGNLETYGFDPAGNMTCMTFAGAPNSCAEPGGSNPEMVNYTFNSDGQMSTVTDWLGTTFTYSYNAAGTETGYAVSGNGGDIDVAYGLDGAARTTSQDATDGSTAVLDLAYTLDDDGNVTADSATGSALPSGGTTGYAQFNSQDESSGYSPVTDPAPNNISYTPDGPPSQWPLQDTSTEADAAYDEAGDLCWTATSASGSCSSPPSGATLYAYNADSERVSTTPPSGDPSSYGWNSAAETDCVNTDGTTCSTSAPTATTTTIAYDGDANPVSETTGGTTTALTWAPNPSGSGIAAIGTEDYIWGVGSEPLEQVDTTNSHALAVISDSTGARGLISLWGSTKNSLVNYTDYSATGEPESGVAGVTSAGLSGANTGLSSTFTQTSLLGYSGDITGPGGLDLSDGPLYDPSTDQMMAGPGAELQPLSQMPEGVYDPFEGAKNAGTDLHYCPDTRMDPYNVGHTGKIYHLPPDAQFNIPCNITESRAVRTVNDVWGSSGGLGDLDKQPQAVFAYEYYSGCGTGCNLYTPAGVFFNVNPSGCNMTALNSVVYYNLYQPIHFANLPTTGVASGYLISSTCSTDELDAPGKAGGYVLTWPCYGEF